MFTIKRSIATITIGIVVFLVLEAYGFYSIRRTLDVRLEQLDGGLEAVRAADMALSSQVQAQAATPVQAAPVPAPPKDPAGVKSSFVVSKKAAALLQKMLPARTSVNQASMGFRNERDFISAVCISRDLSIPFARMKSKMTGNHAVSIEAAIRELRPDLSKAKAKAEVQKGQRQAVEIARLGKSAAA